MYHQHSFCSYCGASYAEGAGWPRHCEQCGHMTYRNPLPVSVVVQPIGQGLLAVRRLIDPGKGRLALPGGFIEVPESWQEAGARELYEETGIRIAPDTLSLFRVYSAPDGTLLVFGRAPRLTAAELPRFQPNEESSDLVILTEPIDLAFSLHSRVVREYFAANKPVLP